MPDETGSSSQTCYHRALALAAWGLWVLAATRFTVERGSRRAPGYNRRRRFALCPECGEKVRVQADGWCYCRDCGIEFEFKEK
jgi:hypothetical protein